MELTTILYMIGGSILITLLFGGLPLYLIEKSVKKTKEEVEKRNAALHILYHIPYKQKDGNEIVVVMKADGNKKDGRTLVFRCKPDIFSVVEEYDEKDMKFLATLVKEGYYNVDENYMYCKDWKQYSKSGTIYEGKWKDRNRAK